MGRKLMIGGIVVSLLLIIVSVTLITQNQGLSAVGTLQEKELVIPKFARVQCNSVGTKTASDVKFLDDTLYQQLSDGSLGQSFTCQASECRFDELFIDSAQRTGLLFGKDVLVVTLPASVSRLQRAERLDFVLDGSGVFSLQTEEDFRSDDVGSGLDSADLTGFFPTLQKGDTVFVGLFRSKSALNTDPDFSKIIGGNNGVIFENTEQLKQLASISADGNEKRFSPDIGCDLNKAFGNAEFVSRTEGILVETDAEDAPATPSELCTLNVCEVGSVVNIVERLEKVSFLVSEPTLFNGEEVFCRETLGAVELLEFGVLEYRDLQGRTVTAQIPKRQVAVRECCPGIDTATFDCSSDGRIIPRDPTEPEEAKECIIDDQCGDPTFLAGDGNVLTFFACNDQNKCEISRQIETECSPEKPCGSGFCDLNTGTCVGKVPPVTVDPLPPPVKQCEEGQVLLKTQTETCETKGFVGQFACNVGIIRQDTVTEEVCVTPPNFFERNGLLLLLLAGIVSLTVTILLTRRISKKRGGKRK